MQTNNIHTLNKSVLTEIYTLLSEVHSFDPDTIDYLVRKSIGLACNSVAPVFIDKNGLLTIIREDVKKGNIVPCHINLSKKNEKAFKLELNHQIEEEKRIKFASSFKLIVKQNGSLFYGLYSHSSKELNFFRVFSLDKEEFPNTIAYIETKDLFDIPYEKNKFYLISTEKSPFIKYKNGFFSFKAYCNSKQNVTNHLHKALKKINFSSVEDNMKYSYRKINYFLEKRELIVFLYNTYISKIAHEFLVKFMRDYCGYKLTIITSKK